MSADARLTSSGATRRRFVGLMASLAVYPSRARATSPEPSRVAALDWAATETLTALGTPPIAVTDIPVFRQWMPDQDLPASTVDLGSRSEPNLELLAQLAPDLIFASNWQASLLPQFNRIAPTEVIALIDPPSSSLENARRALLTISEAVARRPEGDAYLRNFENAIDACATQLRAASPDPLIVGVLHENGRQLFAYGAGSWVDEIMNMLGVRNALRAPTSRFGNALIDLAQLASTPEAKLLYLDQGGRTRRAELALRKSTLWTALPQARPGRAIAIPAFYALGGLPSALRCARLIRDAVTTGDPRAG